MCEQNPVRSFERIRRIYSERRQTEIAVRIRYDVEEVNGCRIIELKQLEVLEPVTKPVEC